MNNMTNLCPICLLQVGKRKKKSLPCGHYFHWRCIDKWLENNANCPICRSVTCNVCKRKQEQEEEENDMDRMIDDTLFFLTMTTLLNTEYNSSPN